MGLAFAIFFFSFFSFFSFFCFLPFSPSFDLDFDLDFLLLGVLSFLDLLFACFDFAGAAA